MPDSTSTLTYAGETFKLTFADAEKLKRLFDSPTSGTYLWRFIPADSDREVALVVGPGIPLVLRKNPEK